MDLYSQLKSRFSGAQINELEPDAKKIEIIFKKASMPVTIFQLEEPGRYAIEYPLLKAIPHKGKIRYMDQIGFGQDVLIEGVLWILKKVQAKGKVYPEIMDD